ncbi:MAG: hypothetical protein BWK76_17970 [Desulfobulbaceae bacterium A2]|nr:MAG: hypothetical protein BWK76_17970 [Desulfobulbaceae bacterium A2]
MQALAVHVFLLSGAGMDDCIRRVRHFLDHNALVRYAQVEIVRAQCCHAGEPQFHPCLHEALAANRRALDELCRELRQAGCHTLDDLAAMEQGYRSKLLHTMTHLLDGFFGIDSAFYDLDEGAHQITPSRQRRIAEQPEQCWLIQAHGSSPDGPGFERLRGDHTTDRNRSPGGREPGIPPSL